ncbi:RNA polymerase sigma-70 factor (ECF subfamily) [Caulobacter ginsengisoli]|uniref:RNA polymerase sigma-70 factor (ECF subfamily) n=1 Tax=Caulobacter ginsengisoli TaxID=400775 RepID=A0ABU0INV3_9CAUL|nr:sigma-70 family RNA polymerase sigma factor [Caulobacter ginsengisoli]MDQ0463688.1 RNA polymerase sigma-70 factor (ECF subfamily) [Caulobacter ginsengisoli]
MSAPGPDTAAAVFDPLRPRLVRAAYRMLGSVADAEDIVQEAFIRWLGTDRGAVRDPAGFLIRVVTRLSLDLIKSAHRRRETYVGPWLPEPIVEAEDAADVDDVTLPLLLALERLSPLERAAFLLHDVFGQSFAEIAEAIGRDETACRQLASRARTHVRTERPRFDVPREHGLEIAQAFFTASRQGDMGALRSLLAADVVLQADGGGKRPAAMVPIEGLEAVMAVHERIAAVVAAGGSKLLRLGLVNGLPGFVTMEPDGVVQTTALEVANGRIVGIYVVRNPDKLERVASI